MRNNSSIAVWIALASAASAQPAAPGEPAALDLQPFRESIAGTVVTFDMVPVPAGSIEVVDPADPAKTINVAVGPFWAAITETTWDLYDIFVYKLDQPIEGEAAGGEGGDAVTRPSKPYIPPDRGFGHAGYPAISMTHHGATEFCRWLSAKTGRTYRLPTEAEWQYLARAGAIGPEGSPAGPSPSFAFGDEVASLGDHAWFDDNAGFKTQPVAQKRPNAWGLFDVHGNAAEWCDGLDGQPVVRGGSFRDQAPALALTHRVKQAKSWNASDPQLPKSKWWLADCNFVGFRVICVPRDDAEEPAGAPLGDR